MRKRIIGLLLMVSTVMTGQHNINLIPLPAEMEVMQGQFRLKPNCVIGYNQKEGKPVAEMLAKKLNASTGFNLRVMQDVRSGIQLNINSTTNAKTGSEGYVLITSKSGVIISANTPAGLFYGMQTLLQLFPKEIENSTVVKTSWEVPAVSITDYPRFAWRGMMLDVSRNFFTKEEVKKYIDEVARFKFNTFHWHLTDDNGWRIEIKALPKLTEVGAWRVPRAGHFGDRTEPQPGEPATEGGYYTHDDILEVIQYAKERFVTIIPEIDVPGHSMAALAAYPQLSTTKNPETRVNPGTNFAEWYGDGTFKMFIENTLNPSDENVYDFLDKVFTEIAALFPAPYIHVGGDECYKGFWKNDSACLTLMQKENMKDVEELQGYFMKRVENILNAKGKKLLGWDEILDGGISPGATVMSWRGIKGGVKAAQLGHNVVMTPTSFCYLDYCQGDPVVDPPIYSMLRLNQCYSFNPVPEGVNPDFILGGQGNLWSEQIATFRHVEYMAWPRGWALAEDFWSPDSKKSWNGFIQRVENQFERSAVAQINYSKAMYDAIVNIHLVGAKMLVEMATEVPDMEIFYSVDGSMPDHFSLKYTVPFELPEGPVTLRVVTYRNGSEIGHLITLKPEDLKARAK